MVSKEIWLIRKECFLPVRLVWGLISDSVHFVFPSQVPWISYAMKLKQSTYFDSPFTSNPFRYPIRGVSNMLQNVNMPYTLTVRSRQGCSDAIGPVASFLQLLHKCHGNFSCPHHDHLPITTFLSSKFATLLAGYWK